MPLVFNLGFLIESTSTFHAKTKRIHLFFQFRPRHKKHRNTSCVFFLEDFFITDLAVVFTAFTNLLFCSPEDRQVVHLEKRVHHLAIAGNRTSLHRVRPRYSNPGYIYRKGRVFVYFLYEYDLVR